MYSILVFHSLDSSFTSVLPKKKELFTQFSVFHECSGDISGRFLSVVCRCTSAVRVARAAGPGTGSALPSASGHAVRGFFTRRTQA